MKFAIIHDWLIGMRGGEKVLEEVCALFPDSEIFTLFYIPENVSPLIRRHRIHTSFLQNIPGALKRYRYFLPLYPAAVRRWKFDRFDAVISISHCAAKGVHVAGNIPHFCYCLTPMRYIWDNYNAYFSRGRSSLPVRSAMRLVRPFLKRWDVRTSHGVDHFIAISEFVADRIRRYYGAEPNIIHPPVATDFFHPAEGVKKEPYCLVVSALVPYKKIDIAVSAFNKVEDISLKIVGIGPEYKRLQRLSKSSNIEFIQGVSPEELRALYQRARCLIHCGEEDFGIAMVEAQACGTPVVAYHRGGAAEIVDDGSTGLLFSEPTPPSLTETIQKMHTMQFSVEELRRHALKFSTEVFREKMEHLIVNKLGED